MGKRIGTHRPWRATSPRPVDDVMVIRLAADLAEAREDLAACRAALVETRKQVTDLTGDRDAWRTQALAVSDRYADAREDIRRTSALDARVTLPARTETT